MRAEAFNKQCLKYCRLFSCLIFLSLNTATSAQEHYRLNPQMGPSADVLAFKISPDNRRVIYVADKDTDELPELYMVPLEGGASIKLSHGVLPISNGSAGVSAYGLHITPDSRRVIYRGSSDATPGSSSIYIVPITGSSDPIEVPNSGPSNVINSSVFVTPDSEYIIYDSAAKLFRVPVRGGTPVKISGQNSAGGDHSVETRFLFMNADGDYIVYEDGASNSIYSVPTAGGAAVLLSPRINTAQDFRAVAISPDSKSVAYVSDKESNGIYELFITPITGGGSDKLSLAPGVDDFKFTADSKGILYELAPQSAVVKVYSVDLIEGIAQEVGTDSYSVANKGNEFAVASRDGVFLKSIEGNSIRRLDSSGMALGFVSNDRGFIYQKFNTAEDQVYTASTTTGRSKLIYQGKFNSFQEILFPPRESRYAIIRYDTKQVLHGIDKQAYFVVSLENGNAKQLSAEFNEPQTHLRAVANQISPRKTHFVYLIDQNKTDRFELFAAEIEIPTEDDFCYVQKVADKQSIYVCL